MNKNDFYNTFSNIDEKYLNETENVEAITSDYKKAKHKRTCIISSFCCFALLFVGVAYKVGLFDSKIPKNSDNTSMVLESDENTSSTVTTEYSTADTSSNEQPAISDKTLYYSHMVNHTDDISISYGSMASIDVLPFDESFLKGCNAIVEGEIIDMYVKEYLYDTSSDKFEPNGVLHNNSTSLVYKIKVANALYGNYQPGDVITVEDEILPLDSVTSIHKGSKYIIPLCESTDEIWTNGEYISGDITKESNISTLYQFQPQIEAVEGGYIVPDTWKTIITDKCQPIILDLDNENIQFFDDLYFVPTEIFNTQIDVVIQKEMN